MTANGNRHLRKFLFSMMGQRKLEKLDLVPIVMAHFQMNFPEKLKLAWRNSDSLVCVGLDPRRDRLPVGLRSHAQPFLEFNRRIIEATWRHACAFKPQIAYYAAENRIDELLETIRFIRECAPDRVVILDAKRGDIGSTAEQYAREAFEIFEADAVTVNPYMGGDTLEAFTRHADRGVIVLCKTSNPGSVEFQDLQLEKGHPLYLEVAKQAAGRWNANGNICLVVGATYPDQLSLVRKTVGDMPLLVPGIGAQGGDIDKTLRAGLCRSGDGLIINSSRAILYASSGEDFATAAGKATEALKQQCNEARNSLLKEISS